MTLAEKAGQVLIGYAYGSRADDTSGADANRALYDVSTPSELVTRYRLGGLVLLDHNSLDPARPRRSTGNVDSPAQVAALTSGLQEAARAAGAPPLLVAVDQEGGLVNRIQEQPGDRLPGQMALGAADDEALTRSTYQALGRQLAELGVNVDFAPVADVNADPANPVIGTRAFGAEPALVARLTSAAVRGLADGGVAATAKHFPGHGDTRVDSHEGLPRIEHDRAVLDAVDLPPFRAAIEAEVPIVMTGHLLVPALDPHAPATLSRAVLDGLLRQELGFDGVVITDGMWMAAVRERLPDAAAAVEAINAGVDLVLMPPSLPDTVTAIQQAVVDGALPTARLDEAVRRVLTLKWRLGLAEPDTAATTPTSPPPDWSARGRATAAQVTAAATTLVTRRCDLVPLRGPVTVHGERDAAVAQLTEALRQNGANVVARGARVDVLVTGRPGSRGEPSEGARKAGADSVVVALGPPYDLAHFDRAGALVATYSDVPAAINAAAAVLTGNASAPGRLPVPLSLVEAKEC